MKSPKQKLIVFDLDETLIHATNEKLAITQDFQFEDNFIYKRPKLNEFLVACSQIAEIAIWSSAEDDYVAAIVKELIPREIKTVFIWGRGECWIKIVKQGGEDGGMGRKVQQFIKPLEKIRRKGYKMKNLLIIDDTHAKVTDNPGNYLLINPFEGDPADDELTLLLEYLKQIAADEDFTQVASKDWKARID
jgi:carboxy-terminal domain RNA polymerase II polypeptide A small phosphatase